MITIIVLLILAGVTIATLTGDNGLLQKASSAKQANEEAEICEKIKLVYAEYQIGNCTVEEIEKSLENFLGERVSDFYINSNKLMAKIKGDFYEYNLTTGKAGKIEPGIGNLITKANYGDFIDLGQSVVGTSATTDDWRILYNDKNGHVYAILADYLPNNNAAVTAAGFTSDKRGTYNIYSSTSRQNLLDRLEDEDAWKTLISTGLQNKGAKVRGATTADIIMASYNEKYGTSLEYTSSPYLRTSPNDSSSSIDTLYMPHPDANRNGYSGCYAYWLDSPYDSDENVLIEVYCNGGIGRERYNDVYRGVCPVVSLPSNIKVTKNGNVWIVVQ